MATGRTPLRWAEDGSSDLREGAAASGEPLPGPSGASAEVRTADYQAERQRILDWVDGLGDPLTLYRGLRVGSPDQVNIRSLGIFWTPVKNKAHSPYGVSRHGVEVIVEARVQRRDVDLDGTVATMRRHPAEMEIRLKIGSTVKVVRLHLPNGRPFPLGKPGRTASVEHYIEKCSSCDDIITRCRCMGPHEIRYAVCDNCKTAVKTKPSFPQLTDEREATNEALWKRVLDVASGRQREYTQGDRTIHAPNDGRGYKDMPAHPKGIAWAVKQYNGFGGQWRGQKEVEARSPVLRVLAAGGVAVSEGNELDAMARAGLIKLSGEQGTRRYWDITAAGRKVALAGLKEELVRKVDELTALGKARRDAPALSDEDKRAMREVAVWFRKHFRVDSAKTPKGQKSLKEEAMRFLNLLEQHSEAGGWTSPAVLNFENGPWGRTLEKELDNLVQHFTTEGDTSKGKKEQVVEIKLSHAVYVNRASISETNFKKYAVKVDAVYGRIKGWRAKALKGNLTVVFQGADRITKQGKYISASDEMWVKATPAVMKRGEGSYGSPDYILVHELAHRYEHFHRLPTDFDRLEWHTTRYSLTESLAGSEAFAELFALGHYDIKGNWDHAIVERFEALMAGKKEVAE